MLEDEQAVGPRLGGEGQGLLDRQLGEGPHDLVGGRRVGRADDARVVPGDAPLQAEGLLGRLEDRRPQAAAGTNSKIGTIMRTQLMVVVSRVIESERTGQTREGSRSGVQRTVAGAIK